MVSAYTGFDGKAAGAEGALGWAGLTGALLGSAGFVAGRAYGAAFDFSGTATAFTGSDLALTAVTGAFVTSGLGSVALLVSLNSYS